MMHHMNEGRIKVHLLELHTIVASTTATDKVPLIIGTNTARIDQKLHLLCGLS